MPLTAENLPTRCGCGKALKFYEVAIDDGSAVIEQYMLAGCVKCGSVYYTLQNGDLVHDVDPALVEEKSEPVGSDE